VFNLSSNEWANGAEATVYLLHRSDRPAPQEALGKAPELLKFGEWRHVLGLERDSLAESSRPFASSLLRYPLQSIDYRVATASCPPCLRAAAAAPARISSPHRVTSYLFVVPTIPFGRGVGTRPIIERRLIGAEAYPLHSDVGLSDLFSAEGAAEVHIVPGIGRVYGGRTSQDEHARHGGNRRNRP